MGQLSPQIVIAFVFGVSFVIALIVLAIRFPHPTPFQYNVFRIVLSMAAAGVAAMIPGFIDTEVNPTTGLLISAGGAIAVFVIVYLRNPAQLAVQPPKPDPPDLISSIDIETLKQELISLPNSGKSILVMLSAYPNGLYVADLAQSKQIDLTRREIVLLCKELASKGLIKAEYATDYLYRISPSVLAKLGAEYEPFFEKLLTH